MISLKLLVTLFGLLLIDACEIGQYSCGFLDLSCCDCPAGSYIDSSNNCNACPVGTYSTSSGSTSCTPCLGGTYASNGVNTGSTTCIRCPNKTVSTDSAGVCYDVCPEVQQH